MLRGLGLASGALAAGLIFTPAQASILTKCGPSKGVAYYFESALMPKSEAGWTQDAISKGGLQLVRSGADFDIVRTDAVGTMSTRADGFHVFNVPGAISGRMLLIAINAQSGVVEHYNFQLDDNGKGVVVWGTIRAGHGFPKSGLMKADCTGP